MIIAAFILAYLLWHGLGVAALIYWWTAEVDLKTGDFLMINIIAPAFGPLWFIVACLDGPVGDRVLISKRRKPMPSMTRMLRQGVAREPKRGDPDWIASIDG